MPSAFNERDLIPPIPRIDRGVKREKGQVVNFDLIKSKPRDTIKLRPGEMEILDAAGILFFSARRLFMCYIAGHVYTLCIK
jgi:hypothetical protein